MPMFTLFQGPINIQSISLFVFLNFFRMFHTHIFLQRIGLFSVMFSCLLFELLYCLESSEIFSFWQIVESKDWVSVQCIELWRVYQAEEDLTARLKMSFREMSLDLLTFSLSQRETKQQGGKTGEREWNLDLRTEGLATNNHSWGIYPGFTQSSKPGDL